MGNYKMALKDNDCVIRARTDFSMNGGSTDFRKFFKDMNEELITGQTAHLEFESPEMGLMTFEISKTE
jgi:hypothetical protein